MFVSSQDHRDAEGNIDWAAYREAMVNNGDICTRCKAHILLGGNGHRRQCNECDSLSRLSETSHHSLIRCPACRAIVSPADIGEGELFDVSGDSVDVSCPECEADFTVEVRVEFHYTSPEVVVGDNPDEDDE